MDTGIGATLREAREAQGRSIDDVALALRARVSQLRDLEEERFDTFGGDVYAKGFLKSYALELGLDPAPLLETYRREVSPDEGGAATLVSGSIARPRRERAAAPPGWVAAVVIVVIVIAVIGFVGALGPGTTPEIAGQDDDLQEAPPSPADEDDVEPDDADGDADADAGGDAEGEGADEGEDAGDDASGDAEEVADEEDEAEAYDGVELLLEFEDTSWMRVVIDGTVVLEETVAAGEILPFEGEEEIVVRFGNAGGVRAQLNGEDLGAQGGRGDVVNVVFTPDGAETA